MEMGEGAPQDAHNVHTMHTTRRIGEHHRQPESRMAHLFQFGFPLLEAVSSCFNERQIPDLEVGRG